MSFMITFGLANTRLGAIALYRRPYRRPAGEAHGHDPARRDCDAARTPIARFLSSPSASTCCQRPRRKVWRPGLAVATPDTGSSHPNLFRYLIPRHALVTKYHNLLRGGWMSGRAS
jgi:hypothetical protein